MVEQTSRPRAMLDQHSEAQLHGTINALIFEACFLQVLKSTCTKPGAYPRPEVHSEFLHRTPVEVAFS